MSSYSTKRRFPIFCVDCKGVQHLTMFSEGSKDELRFYRVAMISGDCFSSQKKVFFENKAAWDEFNSHHRDRLAKDVGGFVSGQPWPSM